MISDDEIAQFEPNKQAQIRSKIAQLVERGREPRHLMLTERGAVLLDREAIDTEILKWR